MGWLIMYCVVFMLALGTAVNYSTERRDRAEMDEATVISGHMAVLHQAAMTYCREVPTGCEAAREILPSEAFSVTANGKFGYSVLAAAPVFQSFHSLVDPASKILVTFYRPTSGPAGRWSGQMVAAMTNNNGWNITMGQYDAAKQLVDRAAILDPDNPAVALARVPNMVAGVAIPDQAPIIVSRMF